MRNFTASTCYCAAESVQTKNYALRTERELPATPATTGAATLEVR